MISKKECFSLGHFAKTRGFKGELSLFLDVDIPEEYANLKRLLVDLNGVLTPFFVEKIEVRNNGFADVRLEDISDRESATILSGKTVFLPLSELPELPEDQYYLHELEGMVVVDKSGNELGRVRSVIDYGNNPLLELMHQKVEAFIPIVDEFILEVDKKEKKIIVDLPDGLLEINKA